MLHVSVREEHNGVMHMRALHLHDLLKMIGLLVFLSSASQNLLVKFAQLVKCNIFPVKFPFIFIFLANSKKFFFNKSVISRFRKNSDLCKIKCVTQQYHRNEEN